jgi:hypothetical protein
MSARKGIIWIMLAALAEVPAAVRSGYRSSASRFRSLPFYITGVHLFEPKWYVFSATYER